MSTCTPYSAVRVFRRYETDYAINYNVLKLFCFVLFMLLTAHWMVGHGADRNRGSFLSLVTTKRVNHNIVVCRYWPCDWSRQRVDHNTVVCRYWPCSTQRHCIVVPAHHTHLHIQSYSVDQSESVVELVEPYGKGCLIACVCNVFEDPPMVGRCKLTVYV